jgi:hypothetical protein
MKKITLLIALLLTLGMNAQEVVYSADFTNPDVLDDWTILDEDGDGVNWSIVTIVDDDDNPVAGPLLRSASWNGAPLNPDNWAITPVVSLADVTDGSDVTLTWEVSGADAGFADENYTVYVATGNTVSDFTSSSVSFNELVTDNGPGGLENVYTKTLDISSFAGDDIYVAFRHHNVSDEFTIEIHSVEVISETLSNETFVADNNFVSYNDANNLNLESSTILNSANIFAINGKQILSTDLDNQSNAQLNISGLNQGVYVVKLSTEAGIHSFKFAK